MSERKCSRCGSDNVYKNLNANWHKDGVVVQAVGVEAFNDLFETEAFLCLDCRYLEILVVETTTRYGRQQNLAEAIRASRNWQKVSAA